VQLFDDPKHFLNQNRGKSKAGLIEHESWKMTRSWSFVVSVPKLELGNQRTCVIVTLIHDEPHDF
jgi:hypothetical protein